MEGRIGLGYDIHPLVRGKKLFLGGVEIEHSEGLLGHSDADVVLHSLCDALLGALALGDLGDYFPPGDPVYEGMRSDYFLRKVLMMLKDRGYSPYQVDITVVAQVPRLKKYISAMRENISSMLGIDIGMVSVKAVSPEGLGALGRGEGISAITIVKVVKSNG
ncbi:MAG: 2-C-methyl-D-erythritol 2,4-cyclodiphosphate synthase [Synergistetes bacterium]|nr:2-C-methyl-D-erythritol 2,4-cyclodiphosphate synthase [Synergistota bacterium]